MDYRNERDGLRARVESLEAALATAQAEVERMRATEAALDAAKREIEQLRNEVGRLPRNQARTPQQGGGKMLVGLGVLTVLGAVCAAFVLLRGGSVTTPGPAAPEPPPAATTVVVADPPASEPPPPPPAPRPATPPAPAVTRRTAHAEWAATVVRSQGAAPGGACKVAADLAGDGARAGVREVEVSCGARVLYRSTDHFSGVSNNASDVTEVAGKVAGTLRHTLLFQDQGTRSGRAQISLDTNQRSAVVWSDNVPTFRVELRMEPLSLARTGEALIDEENRVERLGEAVVRAGTVTKVEGEPGAAVGKACTVEVSPAQARDSNCRVRVRCDGKVLYGDGGSGYNQCPVKGGRPGPARRRSTQLEGHRPGAGHGLARKHGRRERRRRGSVESDNRPQGHLFASLRGR